MSYSPECVKEFEAKFPPMTETFFHPRAGYMVDRDARLPHKDYSLQVEACANQNAALAAFAATWDRVRELEYVLSQIVRDLPSRKDWLDPDIERSARKLLEAE